MSTRIVYFASIDSPEYEGMFDEEGTLIDYWHCNDATWRGEYFDGFMEKIGVEIIYRAPRNLEKKMVDQLKEIAGADDGEDYEDS